MHIVKQREDPINAIMRSNAGKTIAMNTISAIRKMRIAILTVWWILSLEGEWRDADSLCESTPQMTSQMAISGRQLHDSQPSENVTCSL